MHVLKLHALPMYTRTNFAQLRSSCAHYIRVRIRESLRSICEIGYHQPISLLIGPFGGAKGSGYPES